MNDQPSIRGQRIGIREARPQRSYVYNGSEPFIPKPADEKGADDARRSS